jgi:hypothetical protein
MRTSKAAKYHPTDEIKLRGALEYVLRNAFTGEIVKRGRTENAVVFRGRSWVLSRIGTNTDSNYIQALAIGISSGNNDSSQTQMHAYTTIKTIGTTAITTASNSTPSFSWAVSFTNTETFNGSSQIREFALYNSASTGSGTMLARAITASDINFATSNTLAITYTISN